MYKKHFNIFIHLLDSGRKPVCVLGYHSYVFMYCFLLFGASVREVLAFFNVLSALYIAVLYFAKLAVADRKFILSFNIRSEHSS